ncbi:hypothetical protein D9Q98_007550 [Chlorella vulgaris]|uniref:Transcription factor Iwr1 domain-containing protein n=1 Tax=Chlorella vulgaris TaxID=3077 RepID=A0A9D4YVP4_CHLVU|nr:hypothetical protein D9Q98_007550 [Chlorella vulgaris]
MGDAGQADAVVAPSARLRLIRVKRKRGSEAPDDLVVEGLGVPGKRANTSLSSAMGGLGLEGPETGAGSTAEAADEAAVSNDTSADAPARRPQRYRKLSTLSATQLRAMDQQQLHNLLVSGVRQEQEGRRRVGVKAGSLAASAAEPSAERTEQRLQAGQSARYEHIRRRRGLSAFSITEQAEDPLQQLAAVYDVVRHEPLEQEPGELDSEQRRAGNSAAAASAAVQRHHRQLEQPRAAAQQQRRPSRAQRAVQQYDEGTLICNYLPMIRQYLESQGRHMPEPRPAQQQQPPAGSSGGQGGLAGMEEGDDEAGSDSEYVYDLYAAAEGWGMGDGEEEQETRQAQDSEWWELHASGRAPVVQILDDDTWVVLEQSDADDSNDGTEDSNAEGYYAHDYPEEASDLESSDGGGYDPEGSTFAGSRRRQQDWDSDAGSSEED